LLFAAAAAAVVHAFMPVMLPQHFYVPCAKFEGADTADNVDEGESWYCRTAASLI